jgi:hypothetical protein
MKTSLRRFFTLAALTAAFTGATTCVPASASEPVARPKQLCIYYGWPSLVNGAGGNVARAAAEFGKFDMIVLGDGIEHTNHGDHGPTTSIISALRQAGKEVFGYVDLGVSTQNLPLAVMQDYVNEWQAMGASGIFLDDAGFDYGVTRMRQNEIVDYIHATGLTVFMNAWQIDDALADNDESGQLNPSRLAAGDVYLAESWLVAGGAYQSLRDWSIKADRAADYARLKGVRIAGVTTAALNKALAKDSGTNKFKMGFYGAAMYNLAAWQWTDVGYSSGNNKLLFYDTSSLNYGSQFLSDAVTHLKNYSRHERASDTGKIIVTGNGSSSGTGTFVSN